MIFEKNIQISHFMKIRPVGTELFRAEGKMTFRDFAEAPKKHHSHVNYRVMVNLASSALLHYVAHFF